MSELIVREETGLSEIIVLGQMMAKSGFFSDARESAQAVVKILAGRELGFGPVASMTGIYIVQGRVTLSANLIAAAVKRSGRYDYKVQDHTDEVCAIEFFENGKSVGISRFNMKDAGRAGLSGGNWNKYPRNMLFARAMSNGAKWYCADVFGGPVYTPDELGATVDESGELIDMPPRAAIDAAAELAEAKRETESVEPERPPVMGLEDADLDYEPDWLDTDEHGRWGDLRAEAVAHLAYAHDNHVKNALKQATGGDVVGMTYRTAWHLLQEHQRSKLPEPA